MMDSVRGIRQGNENSEVYIGYYSTKGTFDNYRWQILGKKIGGVTRLCNLYEHIPEQIHGLNTELEVADKPHEEAVMGDYSDDENEEMEM